jgi:hypothetical protein
MKITRKQLKRIINEVVAHAKVQTEVERALADLENNARAVSKLISKGEVTIPVGNVKVTLKADVPPGTRILRNLPPGKIARDVLSDIKHLKVTVKKQVGSGQLVGKIKNPFTPKSKGFGFNITFTGTW